MAWPLPRPLPMRLHPNLSEMYRKKVTDLAATLANPAVRTAALDIIRDLITGVTVHGGEGALTPELEGAFTAMIGLAQDDKSPLGK